MVHAKSVDLFAMDAEMVRRLTIKQNSQRLILSGGDSG